MAFSPFDSPMYRKLYGDDEIATLFSDSAEVRAMLLVEGMLAKVQGELGIIPEDSAFFIHRSSMEVQIDPSGLADGVATDGTPVPALIKSFSKAMEAPDHTQYLHWGVTSQDIMDTALILRLRQYMGIIDARLEGVIDQLTQKAIENRNVIMAARPHAHMATPTTFGAVIAGWIAPLERHRERLAELKKRLLVVSTSGSSSTYAAMGPNGFKVEAALADALKLQTPSTPWHSARDSFTEFASTLSLITGSLGKIGADIILLAQPEIGEINLAGSDSLPKPYSSNTVAAETMITMARHTATLMSQMHGSLVHTQESDAVAWALEWHSLPQICIGCGVSLKHATALVGGLTANPTRMMANIGVIDSPNNIGLATDIVDRLK